MRKYVERDDLVRRFLERKRNYHVRFNQTIGKFQIWNSSSFQDLKYEKSQAKSWQIWKKYWGPFIRDT